VKTCYGNAPVTVQDDLHLGQASQLTEVVAVAKNVDLLVGRAEQPSARAVRLKERPGHQEVGRRPQGRVTEGLPRVLVRRPMSRMTMADLVAVRCPMMR